MHIISFEGWFHGHPTRNSEGRLVDAKHQFFVNSDQIVAWYQHTLGFTVLQMSAGLLLATSEPVEFFVNSFHHSGAYVDLPA